MLSQILLFVVSLVIQSWIYQLLHLRDHFAVAQIAAGSAVAAVVVAAAAVLQCLLLYL